MRPDLCPQAPSATYFDRAIAGRMALYAWFWRSVQMKVPYVLFWVRAGDRYPELADDVDHFIALDGEEEVGVVKWVETGPDHGWFWSLTAVHPGLAFKRPTFGQCATRGQAAHELGACWSAFRAWFGIEDGPGEVR